MNDNDIYMSLRNIGSILYTLYRKLCLLEINHKENTKEYNDVIRAIEYYKKIEDGVCGIVEKTKNTDLMLGISADATMDMCGKNRPKKLIHDPSFIINNKIHPDDLVSMRISARMEDIYVHLMLEKDKDRLSSVYDIFVPQKNKYFLELLTDQANDSEFNDYRKMLLNAKYDFAFVNFKESDKLEEEDESLISANSFKDFTDLIEYADKYSKLNKATMLYPKNIRRFLLGIDYIRANLLQMEENNISDLRNIVNFMILAGETTGTKIELEGITAFLEILSFADEDKEKYISDDFSFKRRF